MHACVCVCASLGGSVPGDLSSRNFLVQTMLLSYIILQVSSHGLVCVYVCVCMYGGVCVSVCGHARFSPCVYACACVYVIALSMGSH